jgi:hypothetical protein
MATSTFNEKEIQITSVYFHGQNGQVRFESYPRRLQYKGREYVLSEI